MYAKIGGTHLGCGGTEWRCQGDVVEVASGRQACCGVGGVAAAGRKWQGGMTEATGVPLHCWGGGDVVGA